MFACDCFLLCECEVCMNGALYDGETVHYCLSTLSTIRTERLLEYLALLLPSSKNFDVYSQQLCISGLGANQKPAKSPSLYFSQVLQDSGGFDLSA